MNAHEDSMLLTEPARPAFVRDHPRAGWFAVAAVCFGAFMGQLDASIVTIAFPALQHDFGASLAAVEWVSMAYLLVLIALVAPIGRFADAAGRKLLYLYGFGLFTVASAACGWAPTLGVLVACRALQAVGAAMLQANSVALVVTSVRKEKMRAALSVQAAAQALGLALGPLLGGVLIDSLGWRWVFWVNVPVGIAAFVIGRYLLPRTRDHAPMPKMDWWGPLLLAGAATALLMALSGASGIALPWYAVAGLFVTAAVCTAGFVRTEQRLRHPMFALSMLRPRAVSAGLAGALLGYLVLFAPLALFPQVLLSQNSSANPALLVGASLSALPAGFAVGAVAGERLLPSGIGTRLRAMWGSGACIVASAALVVAPAELPWIIGWMAVLGLGLGMFIPANNAAIMAALPRQRSGTGGGLVNMARGLGTAGGIALVALALHAGGPRAALVGIAVAAAFATLTAVAARQTGRPGAP